MKSEITLITNRVCALEGTCFILEHGDSCVDLEWTDPHVLLFKFTSLDFASFSPRVSELLREIEAIETAHGFAPTPPEVIRLLRENGCAYDSMPKEPEAWFEFEPRTHRRCGRCSGKKIVPQGESTGCWSEDCGALACLGWSGLCCLHGKALAEETLQALEQLPKAHRNPGSGPANAN